MKITINGTPTEATGTVADALEQAGLTGKLATALNGTFLPATARDTPLKDGDTIEAVAPMQGG